MSVAEKIIFVTGLPCIGKTRALLRLCKKLESRYIQFDNYRDLHTPRKVSVDLQSFDIGFPFRGFPLTFDEWCRLIETTDGFISFYKWLGNNVGLDFVNYLEMESESSPKPIVCEISPFVLSVLPQRHPVIMCNISRALHTERLAQKIGCSNEEAHMVSTFYSQAYIRVKGHINLECAINLASLSNSLARILLSV